MLTPRCVSLSNRNGMQITLMSHAATWLSCQVPVAGGLREVLLGCRPEDYRRQNAYLGATIGRYANRIAHSRFNLNEKEVRLVANQGAHQLHGGQGFDQREWRIEKCGRNFVTFSLFSPDGDQGFPGNVHAQTTYHLHEDNTVEIGFVAQSDADTPLNLSNHAYFNLDNAEIGCDVRQHRLWINSDRYLPVDREGIPNAPLTDVGGTSFDFRQGKTLARDFLQGDQQVTKGYDHAFLLNQPDLSHAAARLESSSGDLHMAVYTTQPALQIYSGNYLAGNPRRDGGLYQDYSGIALESQALPDTPNHPEWQPFGGISRAGEVYEQQTLFRFSS